MVLVSDWGNRVLCHSTITRRCVQQNLYLPECRDGKYQQPSHFLKSTPLVLAAAYLHRIVVQHRHRPLWHDDTRRRAALFNIYQRRQLISFHGQPMFKEQLFSHVQTLSHSLPELRLSLPQFGILKVGSIQQPEPDPRGISLGLF